ncbi:MAG: coiled-coil domain-containing protein 22 [Chloroflexi bacterium]|nr:coiled-coil domain-containing protein 22 [Chloroflexota bacterium]
MFQTYLNHFPIAGFSVSIVTAILSYLFSGSETRAGTWMSGYFQTFSVAFLAIVVLGMFIGELLRMSLGTIARGDTDAQYYLEAEIKALQQELAKLTAQYETVSNELERLESSVTQLDDTISESKL